MIDERAIVDPSAKIADDVEIGPFTIVGPHVEIGMGTWVGPHVVIKQNTKIGRHNKIHQFASLGEDPQHTDYKGEETWLEIGDHNIIREYVSLNRGMANGKGITKIGSHNFFMSYAHVAHDCRLGNHIIMANNAQIAGHVTLGDHVIFSAFCASHQFCTIGPYAFLGRCAKIGQDIPPFVLVTGNPGAPNAINTIGLQRLGFSDETVKNLRTAYRIIYRKKLRMQDALAELEHLQKECPQVALFIDSIQNSKRGIARA